VLDKIRITKRQRLLVDTIVANGCSIKEASLVAGYSKGDSGRVTASKTLRLPHIQEYMQQRIRESIGLNATKASHKMLELSTSAKSEYVQLEASKDILDRAGYKPVEKSMSLVQGNINVSIDLT
jgi:phage terminase small subunit|tara:strand:+ start:140 stop:511 length:372 start_codon:yes stop_codon:yes gene_type:complete